MPPNIVTISHRPVVGPMYFVVGLKLNANVKYIVFSDISVKTKKVPELIKVALFF